MVRIALVSCVKKKLTTRAPAQDLYTSQLFRGYRRYAEANADAWYVLSAEHGLISPDQVIAPYERTLKSMRKADRSAWASRVQQQLLQVLPERAKIIFLAGSRYRVGIEPFLRERGHEVRVPFDGLTIGRQLQRLKEGNAKEHLVRFYALLSELARKPGQGRPLRDLPAQSVLPPRGVYFFFESGELRSGLEDAFRVVRVGTHAVSANSKATLRRRLKTHLGTRSGSGNHRGSIFRLHVGKALLVRDQIDLPTWGAGSSRPATVRDCAALRTAEDDCEQRVSQTIGGMPVLWVNVDDLPGPNSARAFIERNAIALLSNHLSPHDPARPNWLGRFNPREEIRESGLWNINHITESHDPQFLDLLERFIERT